MSDPSILWRRLDRPGHEAARLQDALWRLTGTALFVHDRQPCKLDYEVICNPQWQTVSGKVTGWVGRQSIVIELSVDSACRWLLNGVACPQVTGCTDLDLNFSPSTNLLPIRRLALDIGQDAEVHAAWLRFPSFTLEPLTQVYRRLSATTYRYESAGGRFVTELEANEAGFVTHYPGFWQVEDAA
jgi:uncharacterized protein